MQFGMQAVFSCDEVYCAMRHPAVAVETSFPSCLRFETGHTSVDSLPGQCQTTSTDC